MLTRAPFESPSGLNANGHAVATGLDSYYDVGLTGGAANAVARPLLGTCFRIQFGAGAGFVYHSWLSA